MLSKAVIEKLIKLEWKCPNCNKELVTVAWMPTWKVCKTFHCQFSINVANVEIISDKSDMKVKGE